MRGYLLSHKLTEYQVTYAVKEWLLKTSWNVIAYNPPGSQGTFTIPNPKKDGAFRGQSGSESPDIVAVKQGLVLVVEAKPKQDKTDADKLDALRKDADKMSIFKLLVGKVCAANQVEFEESYQFIWSTASPSPALDLDWLGHIQVSTLMPMDVANLPGAKSYGEHFECRPTAGKSWDASYKSGFLNTKI